MNPNDSQSIEQFVRKAVADLPPRPAPRSLEARVLAEIQRRASLPWWRRSYASWPAAGRGAFLACTAAVAGGSVLVLSPAVSLASWDGSAALGARFAWLGAFRTIGESLSRLASHSVDSVSPLYLYGAAAVILVCYGAFVVLGTAAYRTCRSLTS